MRNLLIVLCTLVILAAVLTGGLGTMCAFAIPRDWAFFLGWVVVCAATALVNVALITALKAGRAPRRHPLFVGLAFVDFAVACFLVWGSFSNGGDPTDGSIQLMCLMSLLFAIKGVLTLRLPADPQTADPEAEDEALPSYQAAAPREAADQDP